LCCWRNGKKRRIGKGDLVLLIYKRQHCEAYASPIKTMIRKTEKRILALPPKINKSFLNIDQIKNGE